MAVWVCYVRHSGAAGVTEAGLWLFMVVCDCLWLFVVVYGCLWLFVVVCGCLWLFVVVYAGSLLFGCHQR